MYECTDRSHPLSLRRGYQGRCQGYGYGHSTTQNRCAQSGVTQCRFRPRDDLKILDRIGSPAVQVCYDIGNSFSRGYNIYKEIRLLKGKFPSFHCKDYTGLFGKAQINFDSVKQALVDIDYNGWTVLELEPGMVKPLGHEQGFKANADFLKTLFTFSGVVGIDEEPLEKERRSAQNPSSASFSKMLPISFRQDGPVGIRIVYGRYEKSPGVVYSIRGQIIRSR
jgi:hypothetical protein